jgi:hypothetical protein
VHAAVGVDDAGRDLRAADVEAEHSANDALAVHARGIG